MTEETRDRLDPSIFDDDVWPGEDEVSDEELETRGRPGQIRIPPEGYEKNTYTRKFKLSAGRDPVESTVTTWKEVGYVIGMGGKPSGSEKFAEFNPVNIWVRTQVSGADAHVAYNPGFTPPNLFINLYPGLAKFSQDEIQAMVDDAPEGHPHRGLKGRMISHNTGMRLLAQLCEATGHVDRLTDGLSGHRALRKLSSISDLMADNGSGFSNIPFKIVFRTGSIDYYSGEGKGLEIIAFEAYDD